MSPPELFRTGGGHVALTYEVYRVLRRTVRRHLVDTRWLTGRDPFAVFVKDVGHRPSRRHYLHRRDQGKSFGPDNCYWALGQQRPPRTGAATLARAAGVNPATVRSRLRRGWSPAEAARPCSPSRRCTPYTPAPCSH